MASAQKCSRQMLKPAPSWVGGGAFAADGETLLVADPRSLTIWPFAPNGESRRVLPPLLTQTLRDLPPQVIAQQGEKYFVETQGSRILTLGSNFSLLQQRVLASVASKKDLTLSGAFLWQPAGSDFIAFGDLKDTSTNIERWLSGFVRFPADNPSSFTVLPYTMDPEDPSRAFYQLGFPYLASLGDVGYILLMKNPIEIYRSTKGSADLERLTAFPEGFDQMPGLGTFYLQQEGEKLMERIEGTKMPVGLYGWEGFLFVLTREPEKGGTRWMIHKIDPRKDAVVGSTRIPTRANHLTVVPGAKKWAFLEKGRVQGWGRQRNDRVLFVPAGRLRGSLSSSLCNAGELSP